MIKRIISLSVIIAILMIITNVYSLYAEENTATNVSTKYKIEDLIAKSDDIDRESKSLEKKLKDYADVSDDEERIASLKNALEGCKQEFQHNKTLENISIDSMISLRGKVTIISDGCLELKKKVEERLKNIENLNNNWTEKKEFMSMISHMPFSNLPIARNVIRSILSVRQKQKVMNNSLFTQVAMRSRSIIYTSLLWTEGIRQE